MKLGFIIYFGSFSTINHILFMIPLFFDYEVGKCQNCQNKRALFLGGGQKLAKLDKHTF